MKRNFTLLLVSWCLLNFYQEVSAQENFSCGTTLKLKELYALHPELQSENEQLLLNSRHSVEQRDGSIRSVFTIPVVFHILHTYGSENISDTQVYDQMAILNNDYRKLNADTTDVVPEFESLVADCNIEFRLATIDFQGNCTNGIEHIYSHETTIGDDYSKLNQWPRSKYLNIWVVAQMKDGVAGYAYYPSAVDGFLLFADGIIILQDYIGSIGTSTVGRSRALTHEIGHWLGLSHTWGSTNDPMIGCGDDGMDDTPITRGFNFCPGTNYQTTAAICTPGVVENFQNYMEYSYCSRMFTFDQADYMNFTLQNSTADRDNLVTINNLAATGADVSSAPLCAPVADFHVSNKFVCSGETVDFFDDSWRALVSSYQWSFPTGTPSTSTSANPSVVFNTPGYHTATLTVSNATGTDTKTISQSVWVSYPWVDFIGPYAENFEGSTNDDWLINNPEDNAEKWQLISGVGYSGTHCYKLNNYYAGGSMDPFYQNRLGGNTDALISPAYDLSNTSSATLTFKYAAASSSPTMEDMTEELKVYSSVDCGKTWILRQTISGANLMSAGFTGNNFTPTSLNLWGSGSINLGASVLQSNVRFKFEYTSGDYSNNLFLDDINVNGILGTDEIGNSTVQLNLFPNPTSEGKDLYIQYEGNSNVLITISDINGKTVHAEKFSLPESGTLIVPASKLNLNAGVYFISLSDELHQITKKLVVL